MDDEYDGRADFHVIEAAIRAMGWLRPTDEGRPVWLLDRVEDAINELLKLQEKLSDIIEQQVERRALLMEFEKTTAAEFPLPINGASHIELSAGRLWKYLRLRLARRS